MALALNNLKRVDMPLNKETKPIHQIALLNLYLVLKVHYLKTKNKKTLHMKFHVVYFQWFWYSSINWYNHFLGNKFKYSFYILKCWLIVFTGYTTELFTQSFFGRLKSLTIIIYSNLSDMNVISFNQFLLIFLFRFRCYIVIYSTMQHHNDTIIDRRTMIKTQS